MSRQRKRDAVLRLLRGEDLDTVSRALGVTAATLSGWREAFLEGGEASLASQPVDGEDARAIASSPGSVRCCLSANCWSKRSRSWRAAALWPAGGRGDELCAIFIVRQTLWRGQGLPCLAHGTGERLPASPS